MLQELTTTVVASQERAGQHLVVLQETIFYPTGGGQPHDLGTLNGELLLDVFEEDGIIYHVLENPLSQTDVECVLDWARRLDHMQQHTGQHLLSAVFAQKFGYATASFHLGAEYCSIDISTPSLPTSEQEQVEAGVNELIFANLPVLTYNVTPAELAQIPVRKLPQVEGDLRIVEIQGIDYSPCSGTHVATTGEISLLKIIKVEKYKGMTRVYFLCGQRALQDYQNKHSLCTQLVALLSVPQEELPTRVQGELQHRLNLERRVQELQAELLRFKAQEIVVSATEPTLYLDLPGASLEEAQHLARAILSLGSFCVSINLGDRLVLTHNLAQELNLGQLVKEHAQPLGGRGGGSATSAQVFFAQPESLQEFLNTIKKMCNFV